MKAYVRSILGIVLATFVLALLPGTIRAEVTRVEISSREDVLGGKAFGTVGAYEMLYGTVYFAVDPNNEHNQIIADLDIAPKNSQGKVEFSSDLFILKPKDPSKGNGVAFFDKVNRGRLLLLGTFNHAARSNHPTVEADFGDGWLMREGYTLVAVGWQFDVRKDQDPQLIGVDVPIATDKRPDYYRLGQPGNRCRPIDRLAFVQPRHVEVSAARSHRPQLPVDRERIRRGWSARRRTPSDSARGLAVWPRREWPDCARYALPVDEEWLQGRAYLRGNL